MDIAKLKGELEALPKIEWRYSTTKKGRMVLVSDDPQECEFTNRITAIDNLLNKYGLEFDLEFCGLDIAVYTAIRSTEDDVCLGVDDIGFKNDEEFFDKVFNLEPDELFDFVHLMTYNRDT